jgi:hypothetical protein
MTHCNATHKSYLSRITSGLKVFTSKMHGCRVRFSSKWSVFAFHLQSGGAIVLASIPASLLMVLPNRLKIKMFAPRHTEARNMR